MEPVTAESVSFASTLVKGGWAMLPLMLCSVVALGVIIERAIWGPRVEKVIPRQLFQQLVSLIRSRQLEQALQICKLNNSPLSRVVATVLTHLHLSRSEIMEAVQVIGRREAAALQKHLGALSTVSAVGPLLGLLGTVVGMISMFAALAQQGVQGSATQISSGISEALISTATGLIVAVPSLVFYRFYLYRARIIVAQLEALAFDLVDELTSQPSQATAIAPSATESSSSPQSVVRLHEVHR
jgi:biopolymer transport protein ExbB